jgi:hypothetical protein
MRTAFLALICATCFVQLAMPQVDPRWKPNDPDRPLPPVIEPGTASTQDAPGHPPSDAVVLFDGKDLSQWLGADNQPAKWKVADSHMEVVPHTGYIHTRQSETANCTSSFPSRCLRLAKARNAATAACF